AVYKSTDDGQSWPVSVPLAAPGDRPWLTALENNEVYLYVNAYSPTGRSMQVSRDPNLLVWERLPTPHVTSKSVPDPLDPYDSMIGPNGPGKFSIGTYRDGSSEMTWEDHNFG